MECALPSTRAEFSTFATTSGLVRRLAAERVIAGLLPLLLAFCLLSACSSTGNQSEQTHSHDSTEELFASAYGHVQAHYIEPIGMDTIALASLNRLSVIDGRMQVATRPGAVLLLKEGKEVRNYSRPERDDRDAWAALTADVVDASREASPVSAATPPEEIYDALMDGMVSTLDRYSRYENTRSAEDQRESRNGFGGIGVTIRSEDDRTVVVETLPDTPAAEAGLQPGDTITHVDGKPLEGRTPSQIIHLLRGRVGTIAVVDVLKAASNSTVRLSLMRVHIVPPSVVGRLENEVAFIRIRSFNRETSADLEDEVERLGALNKRRLAGLVLDLRDNPGGLLDQALESADLFLASGPLITTRGRHPAANSAFAADSHEIAAGVPLAILMNGRSASASEMLAASLQDRGRAIIVGSVSHGKGSVQNLQEMPNGGELIITWSRMLTPSGYVLDGLGVLPNICTSTRREGDALAALRDEQDRLVHQFQDWHRYDRVDLGLATTLRRACPPSLDAPESDMILATRVLLEPSAYALALSPIMKASAVARTTMDYRRRS